MCPMSSWKLSLKKIQYCFSKFALDMFSENYGTFWLFPCLYDTDETNGKFYYWLNNIFQGFFFLKPMKQIGNSIFTNFDFWHTLNQPWPTVRRLFDWTNMAAALPQFFGPARHPCFEVSGKNKQIKKDILGHSIFEGGICPIFHFWKILQKCNYFPNC